MIVQGVRRVAGPELGPGDGVERHLYLVDDAVGESPHPPLFRGRYFMEKTDSQAFTPPLALTFPPRKRREGEPNRVSFLPPLWLTD